MPEPTRQYIFTEGQIRGMFAGVTILMIVVLAGLLFMISARPQGGPTTADTRQIEAVLAAASEELSGYRQLEDGTVQIDIDRAIELVADRGVANAFGDLQTVEEVPVAEPPEETLAEAGLPNGAQVYGSCSGCHQGNGQGIPGAFPPLSGHAADLFITDPEYLARVVLFGLQGPITVDGAQYTGLMPAWGAQLSNAQVAAVLNYILSSWGNEQLVSEEEPYSEEDIAALREPVLSMQEVHALRLELDLP